MKNVKKILYVLIILIIAVFIAIYSKNYLFNNSNNKENIELNTNNNSLILTEAFVTKVIDGDTIWVKINNEEKKVRFIGINCPEYTSKIEPYGKEATQYTTDNLLGKTIYLQKDVSETDSYDRLLRYVWTEKIDEITPDNITNYLFNNKLVLEGLAQSRYYKPDISLQDYLMDSQKIAQNNKKGMWQ